MARIRVSTVIDASPASVWEEIRLIERHVDWMADASEIRFTSDSHTGVGAAFDRVTRIGPFRITDALVVTAWREQRELGLTHRGWITGVGRFTLNRVRRDRTRITWVDHLAYPWWLGGPFGAFVGGFVMRRIWRRNLRVLKAMLDSGRGQKG